jgi:hypothetical protein
MIKLINILKETGEISVTPYEYDYDESKHKAFFTTEDGTKYVVYFDISKGEMKVDFGVLYEEDDEDDDVDFEIKTNKGNIYRIMSTVISIIRKALSDFKPNQIKISSDPKRIRLYKIYIKNLNGYILTKEDTFNLILQRK